MAKIYQHERQLEKEIKKITRRRFLHRFGSLIGVLLVVYIQWKWEQVVWTIMAAAFVALYMCRQFTLKNQYGKVKAGLVGEDKVLRILAKLPNTYSVFPDVLVVSGRKESQLDTIVVGPSGVFVVEVKNYAGVIKGNADDQRLHQIKRRSGESTFYNPVKQVSTHAYRLHQFLRHHGMDIWVHGAVYFANESTKVNVVNSTNTPIFSAYTNESKRLLIYIEESQGQELSKREQKAIEKLLQSIL
ncbi:nuclease-related domain-containing protein [Lysinibacillus sp. NPDC096418]|uniref:nuclease-related domain-containing protein n=1 Tax=Lysinibacillus sp. NPDC096418 TaxID=3364138 RepID=UPI0037FEE69B